MHSLEPGETGSKLCATFLNIVKYFKTLCCGCGAVAFIFFNFLKFSTVFPELLSSNPIPVTCFFIALIMAVSRPVVNPLVASKVSACASSRLYHI